MVRTEARFCDPGVVHHNVDAVRVLFIEEGGKVLDAFRGGDVERVERDVCEATVLAQSAGGGELRVAPEAPQSFLTAGLVAGGEVDEEGATVEAGFGILQGEVADDGEADPLVRAD